MVDLSALPPGLSGRGEALWNDFTTSMELDAGARVILAEACRTVDRLERLHWILEGDDKRWISLSDEAEELYGTTQVEIIMNNALTEARQQQLALRQLLAALSGINTHAIVKDDENSLWARLERAMSGDNSAIG